VQASRPSRASCSARGYGSERYQIDPVVLEHALERSGIAGPHKSEKPRWNVHPRDISHALHVEQPPFQRRETAPAFVRRTPFPQSARWVKHVEVRHAVQRHLHAMKHPPRFHHRDVERLPVVGHDQIRIVKELSDRREQRPLSRMAGKEKLAHLEGTEIEVAAADEKRQRARAAAEARRFQVDEDGARHP